MSLSVEGYWKLSQLRDALFNYFGFEDWLRPTLADRVRKDFNFVGCENSRNILGSF